MAKRTPKEVREREAMVKTIMKHHFGVTPRKIEFKPAGMTNFVFEAVCKKGDFIIRIGSNSRKLNDFMKEQWAVERVREKGVPVAEILEVGNEIIPYPYMLQEKRAGTDAMHHPDRKQVIYEVGQLARIIHSIPTSSFGNVFDWSKNRLSKNASWTDFLYHEWKLSERLAFLKKHKVLESVQEKKLNTVIRKMEKLKYAPALNHGDLRLKNVIIDDNGKILALIDWDNCISSVGPLWDLSIALHDLSIDSKQYFLEGYGLSAEEYQEMAPLIKAFNIVNYIPYLQDLVNRKRKTELAYYKLRLNGYFDLYKM